MTYITIDLEWNQFAGDKGRPVPGLEGEIIQLGAVRLNRQLQILDQFKANIAPVYYRTMHRKVEELTGIHSRQLALGLPFPEALRRFRLWCGEDTIFLTWGPDDLRVMRQNLVLHQLPEEWLSGWYNLQSIFNAQTKQPDQNQRSLRSALQHFQIPLDRSAHDALNDAYYTAEICARLDLVRGLAEYDSPALPKIKKEAGTKEKKAVKGSRQRRQLPAVPLARQSLPPAASQATALKAALAETLICPACGCPLSADRWVAENAFGKSYMTLAKCSRHGLYFSRLRLIHKKAESLWLTSLLLYRASSRLYHRYRCRNPKTLFPSPQQQVYIQSGQ